MILRLREKNTIQLTLLDTKYEDIQRLSISKTEKWLLTLVTPEKKGPLWSLWVIQKSHHHHLHRKKHGQVRINYTLFIVN